MRILLAEDDRAVRDAVDRALRGAGYQVVTTGDGLSALAMARSTTVDAVVLDLGLPTMDGLEVCRQLRAAGDRTPILALTARAGVSDRVSGLDAGADDYLTKPFALDELLARMRALLRRAGADDKADGVLRVADLSLDPQTMECHRGSRLIELTRTEYQLLELFLRNPRIVLSRDRIFEKVWGYDFGPESNSLEVYVGYLRRKLEANGEPRLLNTVRGVGYVLKAP
ncbi:MAG: response regulator transcription factor [Chloroflexota bacterium]|nr:response regulator transcription factor [Chloroflexota bacterium]